MINLMVVGIFLYKVLKRNTLIRGGLPFVFISSNLSIFALM